MNNDIVLEIISNGINARFLDFMVDFIIKNLFFIVIKNELKKP